jgi:hypothetical protein
MKWAAVKMSLRFFGLTLRHIAPKDNRKDARSIQHLKYSKMINVTISFGKIIITLCCISSIGKFSILEAICFNNFVFIVFVSLVFLHKELLKN